ncbi:MAG: SDR family oxidoreductase [Planctomycetaceae bacterium]|nr:SDR family oxidoreductase [Planctomycetaceae bacterium]
MKSRVLVTGGSGFIGCWVLRELLERNVIPVVVDLVPAWNRWKELLGDRVEDVVWSDASLLDRDSIQKTIEHHDVAHVIHLAALLTPDCQESPWDGCRVNVLGTTAVFDAARRAGCVKAISYASSRAVHGDEVMTDASASHAPTFYGAFKLAADAIAAQYWRHFSLPSVAIRPHVVYGPLRELGLTAGPSLAIRAAVMGNDYSIGYRGDVTYDYVEDVARAFVCTAFGCKDKATVVDLPGESSSTEHFASLINALVSESAAEISVAGPLIPSNLLSSPHYITKLFPDWATTRLEEGVRRTADYYRRRARLEK